LSKESLREEQSVNNRPKKPAGASIIALAIDPRYDVVTAATHRYRTKELYRYLRTKKKRLRLRKCERAKASRKLVAAVAQKPNVGYVTGGGHGSSDAYRGQRDIAVFEVGYYDPKEVKGKIVHFLSCRTGRGLGPDFVRNGCRAFFGYDGDFAFHPDESEPFLKCDCEIDKAFADGLSAALVYRRVMKLYDKEIMKMRAAGKYYKAATLTANRDMLCCPSSGGKKWGSRRARLYKRRSRRSGVVRARRRSSAVNEKSKPSGRR
jgi:hypothetical protein